MEKETWDKIITDDISGMKKMLDDMQVQLLKYPGAEAWNYIKPLRYMMVEALSDLYQHRWNRIDEANNLIDELPEDVT